MRAKLGRANDANDQSLIPRWLSLQLPVYPEKKKIMSVNFFWTALMAWTHGGCSEGGGSRGQNEKECRELHGTVLRERFNGVLL